MWLVPASTAASREEHSVPLSSFDSGYHLSAWDAATHIQGGPLLSVKVY